MSCCCPTLPLQLRDVPAPCGEHCSLQGVLGEWTDRQTVDSEKGMSDGSSSSLRGHQEQFSGGLWGLRGSTENMTRGTRGTRGRRWTRGQGDEGDEREERDE
ncbi:unnamed protein product, partial [Pleuronectes platessa]